MRYLSKTCGWLLCLAAMSGSCDDAERTREQATTELDAGTDAGQQRAREIAAFEKWRMERDAVYCDPKLEVVCSFEEPGTNYCDFDGTIAKRCSGHSEYLVPRNDCGGVTLGFSGPFGGEHWYYNENFELIGASLSADQNSFCGDFGVTVGTKCADKGEKVNLCTDHDD